MAITQAVCTSFKQELIVGTHNFTATTGDTFKIALYSSSATLSSSTTAYSATNEVSNSGTYTAGGGSLTNITPTTSGTTALTDFSDISFTSATITATAASAAQTSRLSMAMSNRTAIWTGTPGIILQPSRRASRWIPGVKPCFIHRTASAARTNHTGGL